MNPSLFIHEKKVPLRLLQCFLCIAGISAIVWAFLDIRFQNTEGYFRGLFCYPLSSGIACTILGISLPGKFRRPAFWFALALVGQATALQMIDAGAQLQYQHYKPFANLLSGSSCMLVIALAVQAIMVGVGLRPYLQKIRSAIFSYGRIWALVCIACIFVISSAALSRDFSTCIYEFPFASLIQLVNLGNILLIALTIPIYAMSWHAISDPIMAPLNDTERTSSKVIDRPAIIASLIVFCVASLLSFFVYERHPHIPDEVIYLFHARYLAKGMLTIPAPPVPEAFSFYMIPHESIRWYSIFPPGWPLILSMGILLQIPWLINPLLGGINVLLAYSLFCELHGRKNARVGLLLLCTSPWFIFMAMNFLSHTSLLTTALITAVVMVKSRKSQKARWIFFGGCSVGFMSLIRPLDALIIALFAGLYAISTGGKRLRIGSIALLILGAAAIGSVGLLYNKHLTGNFLTFPLTEYYNTYFHPKIFALGFGPGRGFSWPIDAFPGHSPIEALINGLLNLFSVNTELFGWSTGSLFVILPAVVLLKLNKADYFMLAFITAIFGCYSLFWYSGGPDFGARYWYLMIIPLISFAIKGISLLNCHAQSIFGDGSAAQARITAALLSLSVIALINYLPWRSLDKYHHFRGMRPDIREMTKEKKFGRDLILVRGNSYPDYQSAWIYNPAGLDVNGPVYAWDKNSDVRDSLLQAYTGRDIWIINGPSITKGAYEVIDGPLSYTQMMEKGSAR